MLLSNLFCPIIGCGARMKSLDDFEDHYVTRHTASCSVCSRVYPTSRLLSIHVSEAHDSFFQAKAARGYPMVIFYLIVFLRIAPQKMQKNPLHCLNADIRTYLRRKKVESAKWHDSTTDELSVESSYWRSLLKIEYL